MKVTATNWQQSSAAMYWSSPSEEGYPNQETESASSLLKDTDNFSQDNYSASLSEPEAASEGSDSNFNLKSSTPDDSVGQLASMLARAETKMDVLQVYSKAMRALANLKMAGLASESSDSKKIAQMIKRMEKLIKRIQKKLKHLGKEEQLENQRQKAEKTMQEQKEKQIREELRTRRNKRRREEREYALKEMSEDNKTETNDAISSMINATTSAPSLDMSALTGANPYTASSSVSVDISAMEGVSIDVSV